MNRRMTRQIIVKLNMEFRYELEDEDNEFLTDGIPWTDKEIKLYFMGQTAEDLQEFGALETKTLLESMTAEIIELDD